MRRESDTLRFDFFRHSGDGKMNTAKFQEAVDTLKLYRRAEITDDDGKKPIRDLYVDPLPDNHILNTVLKPNTTFIVGRKGTGKSTIFQMAQATLSQKRSAVSAYVDIKTIYESATSELIDSSIFSDKSIKKDDYKRIALFRDFIVVLVDGIKSQIDEQVNSSVWNKFKERFTGDKKKLFSGLDGVLKQLKSADFEDVTVTKVQDKQESQKDSAAFSASVASEVGMDSKGPHANVSGNASVSQEESASVAIAQKVVLNRALKIRPIIESIKGVLEELNLRHLYIFIDDLSELPKRDMETVIDTLLAPLNNWSDEFIKLKVAVYPSRVYTGDIDIMKIDQVYLDIYKAYGQSTVSGMEERAIDFTKRLIEKRISYFCGCDVDQYFDDTSPDFWRTLFYSCGSNPRMLGYILFYAYEESLIHGRKIGVRTIQYASQRYYKDKIEYFFQGGKFLQESFEERSSIYSLKELLESIVRESRLLRNYKESSVLASISGRPPTSHFHIARDYDRILSSLELNFFVSKYYEMKDRDGREVSVYALNHGLCQEHTIGYGRPQSSREHRLYFVERIFDYTAIIQNYINDNQEIVCDNCGAKHSFEQLSALQAYNMLCPSCREGTCRVVNLSRKYEAILRDVNDESLLPATDLGVLKVLQDEGKNLFPKDIAEELDCSYQLVGKRGKNLADRKLIIRDFNDQNRRTLTITDTAKAIYFGGEDNSGLDVSPLDDDSDRGTD